MLKELLFAAKQLGMELDFKPVADRATATRGRRAAEGRRYVITAIGPTLGAPHLHAIASTLAAEGANIEKIGRLSESTLASVEIHALLPPRRRPRRASSARCCPVATSAGFDVSLQREGLYRAVEAAGRDGHGLDADPHRGHRRAGARRRRRRRGRAHHRARHAGRDGLRRVAAPARRPARRGWTSRCWTSIAAEPAAHRRRRDAGPRAQAPRLPASPSSAAASRAPPRR